VTRTDSVIRFIVSVLLWTVPPLLFACPDLEARPVSFGAVEGRVIDRESGKPIAGANVVLAGTRYGAASDTAGRYRIPAVPPGPYTIGVKVIGYEQAQANIIVYAWDTTRRDFALKVEPIPLEEVEKQATRTELEKEVQVSVQKLKGPELQLAGSAAQADLFRTIQALPAVAQVSDFSSELYVRGGSPDQNLVLLDGATIYNPFHFTGYFGAFNSLGIESAELFAGGYPARYGGRASSVLDIKNKVGDPEVYRGRFNADFLSASGLLEGPLPRGSFCISGRRSFKQYLNILNRSGIYGSEIPPYYFYDVQGKVVSRISESNRLVLSGYWADDFMEGYREEGQPPVFSERELRRKIRNILAQLDMPADWRSARAYTSYFMNIISTQQSKFALDAGWGNRAGSAAWQYFPSERFTLSLGAAASRFYSRLHVSDNTMYPGSFRFREGMEDRTLFGDLVWQPVKSVQVRSGFQAKRLDIDYLLKAPQEKLLPQLFPIEPDHVQLKARRRMEDKSAYLETAVDLSTELLASAGLRLTRYEVPDLGSGDVYSYNFLKYSHELRFFRPVSRWCLEPRLGLKYKLDGGNYFKLAWGIYHQNLFLIPLRSGSNIKVLNLWFPLDGKYSPLRADHYTLGYSRYLPNGFSVSADLYYKRLYHFLEQDESYVANEPDGCFREGTGRVAGLELLIRRRGQNAYGWLGYSLSHATLDLGDESHVLWFDQRHRLNLMLHWFSYDRKWQATLSWAYSSGLPYTKIIADCVTPDLQGDNEPAGIEGYKYLPVNMNGRKYAWRYPAYHRLDLSLKRLLVVRGFKVWASVWWVNLYNHRNIFLYRYRGAYTHPGRITMLPSVPFIGLEADF